ncbi:hypothetical protein [Mycolicibacterium cosmeticum]|uniref:hypothetical protein n=1 Tax=Mycolicibacterium cosmeticum TaxID=258533 RepID=UPI0032047B21
MSVPETPLDPQSPIGNTDRHDTLGELASAAREVFGEDVNRFHEDDEGEHPDI